MAPSTALSPKGRRLGEQKGARSSDGGSPLDERDVRGPFGRFLLILLLAVVAIAVSCLLIPVNSETEYPFINARHPIDVGTNNGGRWFYYMPDAVGMTPEQLAVAARKNLIPRGYVEDTTNRPWFRFVKGGHEVIVCDHGDIATAPTSWAGWRVFHSKLPSNTPHENWPVVWVREPTPNPAGLLRFKLQKYARGW